LGLKLNLEKCAFEQTSIKYLSHRIDAEGLHPLQERVENLLNMEPPTDVTTLKSFLGKIGFYERFLHNRVEICAPLYDLCLRDVPWRWAVTEQSAFDAAKRLLCGDSVMVHYSLHLPLIGCFPLG